MPSVSVEIVILISEKLDKSFFIRWIRVYVWMAIKIGAGHKLMMTEKSRQNLLSLEKLANDRW